MMWTPIGIDNVVVSTRNPTEILSLFELLLQPKVFAKLWDELTKSHLLCYPWEVTVATQNSNVLFE